MKKLTIILTGCILNAASIYAQGTGGFFDQQSSKEKLMLAQIAGYETFQRELQRGYTTTENGLNTTSELKNSTYNLHNAYYTSLQQVNPVITANPKGKAITDMQQKIAGLFTAEISWQENNKLLHPDELNYLQQVYANLVSKCNLDRQELTDVLTPGKLQMTDAQRLDRLDKLYASTQDKYAFACSFTAKCRKVALQRKAEQQQKNTLKQLYGIQ
jgi:hypothetical protein